MAQMNSAQARIVDPILTALAHGYSHPEHVGRTLFPIVNTPERSGKVIKFGKESFKKYNLARAPGAKVKRIQVGYGADNISLTQDAIEGLVPIEFSQDVANVPHIDAARDMAINPTMEIMANAEELEQAAKATDATLYDADHKITLAGTDKWSDAAQSDPLEVINTGKEKIRRTTGHYPNKMILSPSDYKALQVNEKIQGRFKYTTSASITTDMLQAYFDIAEIKVGKAVWVPDEDSDFEDAWNATVMAYVPPVNTLHTPSYGYTYRLNGYSIVEQPYFDATVKSWVYPVTDERMVNMTAMKAGFLIKGAS